MKTKVALVTGASGSIGRAIALKLAAEGCDLVLTEHRSCCEEVRKEINEIGRKAVVYKADIGRASDTADVMALVKKEFGRLDILVNNAGLNPHTAVANISEAEWDLVMATNLKGVFFYSMKALEIMKEQKWGRIINISTQNSKDGGTYSGAHYAASKAGINVLTVRLAKEFAPHGITVNAVAPGVVASEMTKQIPQDVYAAFLKKIPLGREGLPEDIAAAVSFFASDSASWITGEIMDVNGGMYMDTI